MPDYTLEQIYPRVFHLSCKDSWKLAMTFLRVQEFYESPKFKGQHFTIVDFMDWYVTESAYKHKSNFTYAENWSGFNVPSTAIRECHFSIPDPNKFDDRMRMVVEHIEDMLDSATASFYLIGSDGGPVISHELAHALWFIEPEYQNRMRLELGQIPDNILQTFYDALIGMNYHPDVLEDEAQAYLATGISGIEDLKSALPPGQRSEIRKPFKKIFKGYQEKCITKS